MGTMRNFTIVTSIAVALGALAPQTAAAQKPSFAVGPQIGYFRTPDADEGRLMVGAAARLKFLPFLGAEGSINYRSDDFGGDAVTVRSWPVMVTGLLYPFPFAYAAVGAGWHNTTFDFNTPLLENESSQEFGWHFGGGLEIPAGRVNLVGDVRYVFLDYDFEEVPGIGDQDADFYVLSAGLLFKF